MKNKKSFKYLSEGKSYARRSFHLINGNVKSRKIAYFKLKQSLSFSELCNATDFLINNLHTSRKELLIGKPLPKNYSELGFLSEFPLLGLYEREVLNPVELTSELNLVLIGIREYKYEINLFLKYKNTYETYLLTGDYEGAEMQLTKIENEICFSLWSLENRFVLKELSGKASENKEFLSQFNDINKSQGITKHLAHYLSLRAEHSLSINRYFNDLELSLDNLKEVCTKLVYKSNSNGT